MWKRFRKNQKPVSSDEEAGPESQDAPPDDAGPDAYEDDGMIYEEEYEKPATEDDWLANQDENYNENEQYPPQHEDNRPGTPVDLTNASETYHSGKHPTVAFDATRGDASRISRGANDTHATRTVGSTTTARRRHQEALARQQRRNYMIICAIIIVWSIVAAIIGAIVGSQL